ncbi:cold shock domain-containing protein E1-like isoform X3 [Daphnia carinata]|uniref:cold shock domain-containing protein E1-like isoform X3 n=1 Tax=Daphnia carinata TaxID=120202 RepID=UPI002868D336|nr:cold shock domain-containing protein E1-like isoform X3 [Daphnia carinata]
MSTNPQWNSSLYSPKSPAPSSLLGFGYNGGSNSGSNLLSSSGPVVNGFNNFPSFGRSNSGSGSFFPSQANPASTQFSVNNSQTGSLSPTLGSSSIGHFPIGTFNANSAFSEESIKSPAAVHVGNGNVHREGGSNSPNNLGSRETGIIEKLLHSYGFIQCCERQARLFFHFSQFDGNIEHLKIGDPVEFEVTYDRRNGKPIASSVSKIAPEVVLSEERVTGTVTTELGTGQQGRISYENRGECFFLPYGKDDVEGNVTLSVGDKVSFQIATSHSGNLGARYIRLENPAHPVRYQGVVCSLKESFGFIERGDVVREIFFHFSEAKGIADSLQLGDDVEFTIQTRNGKEVACSIIKLPSGTVVFEDVNPETLKGQVLKPLERGANVATLNTEPLSGRLRYRGRDRSEIEIPFGDKDQKGEYTLRHGDWVQFNIAVDRRDKLERATNIELQDESFVVSGEKRETGVVAAVKEGYGFIKCAERDARVFFHFSEVISQDEEVDQNSEVEFTMSQDQTQPNKQSAVRIKILPPGSVQFEVITQRNIVGTVTREPSSSWAQRSPSRVNGEKSADDMGLVSYQLNGIMEHVPFQMRECDVRNSPRLGDEVEFDLAQVKRTKEHIGLNIRIVQRAQVNKSGGKFSENCENNKNENQHSNGEGNKVHKGFIASLKDTFGFIENVTHDKEIFFHYSHFDGDADSLDLGHEVQYTLTGKTPSSGKISAENVKLLKKGTIARHAVDEEIKDGIIVRPLRNVNPDQAQYAGLVKLGSDTDAEEVSYEFGITSLANKKDFLQRGDQVQFQIERTEEGKERATRIRVVRKKLRSTVDAIKGQFGFLNYEMEDGKKLFFHLSEVKDNATLLPNDTVEFVLITNQRTGKSSACNIVKMETQRPDWLAARLRTMSIDENGPRFYVLRQPKGPDGTRGFKIAPRSSVSSNGVSASKVNGDSEALGNA